MKTLYVSTRWPGPTKASWAALLAGDGRLGKKVLARQATKFNISYIYVVYFFPFYL